MNSLRIAWRNLLRNRRRTAITAVAIALNTAVLVASLALMNGMTRDMVRSATRLLVGDAQAHAPKYLADRSFYDALDKPEALLAAAKAQGIRAAPRSYGYGLVSVGTKSAGASFIGVDPSAERQAFELHTELTSGTFLDGNAKLDVVIGAKLARSLHAQVGTELVAVVQAADGSLGTDLLHVRGILKTVGEEIDRGGIFMHADDFESLFVSDGRVHEIAFADHGLSPDQIIANVASADSKAEYKTWRQLMPGVSDMVNLSDASLWIFGLVFYLAAALGVLNTMLMATHDRVREFGLLKALGEPPWRIVREVTTEGLVLGIVATAAGVVVGLLGTWYLVRHGIDLRAFGSGSFSFSGIAWDPVWRAQLDIGGTVASVVAMWAACVLASLYPAAKAARLKAARALTHV